MADGDYLLAGVGGGLRGLIEAYKMKMEREGEQAKVRQSGFNQVVTPKVTDPYALDKLTLAQKEAAERERHNRAMEGKKGRNGTVPGSMVNELIGKDLFPPDYEVTPGERILAAQNAARENAPAGARGQYTEIQNARDLVTGMNSEFEGLTKSGETGPLKGLWTGLAAKLSKGKYYPEVESYNQRKEGLVGRLKSVAGEVGRITDDDVKRMGELLAGVRTDPRTAKMSYRKILEILDRGQKNIETAYPGIQRQMGGALPSPSFAPGPTLPPEADIENLLDEAGVR